MSGLSAVWRCDIRHSGKVSTDHVRRQRQEAFDRWLERQAVRNSRHIEMADYVHCVVH